MEKEFDFESIKKKALEQLKSGKSFTLYQAKMKPLLFFRYYLNNLHEFNV